MPALEERIAGMERSLRRQRIATAIALTVAGLAVAIALAPGRSGTVRAESFQLVYGGETLAQLAVAPNGGAFLKLAAPPQNGGSVLVGSVAEDLAGLTILSGGGDVALHASTDPDGNPSLSLSQDGRKAVISVRGDAPPTLLMVGNPGVFAATTRHLWLKDPSGKTLLSTAPGGGPPEEAR